MSWVVGYGGEYPPVQVIEVIRTELQQRGNGKTEVDPLPDEVAE